MRSSYSLNGPIRLGLPMFALIATWHFVEIGLYPQ
jgi:hypothetical protein